MVINASDTRKIKNSRDVECLDSFDTDEDGFIDGDAVTGKVLSSFSFAAPSENKAAAVQPAATETIGIQNLLYTSSPRGLTPPINGESFTVKRSYLMRPSTVRKLNALKAQHPDVNMMLSTMVDIAISHYYNYIFNDSGTFRTQEDKKITS